MQEFRTIEGHPNYKISREGVVVNKRTGRKLKPVIDTNGYARVRLDNKCRYIRRLVCAAFRITKFEWKNIAVLNHKYRSKKINKAERFKWGTMRDIKRPKPHPYKLTHDEVVRVLKMYKDGYTQGQIAEKFGMSQGGISQILKKNGRKSGLRGLPRSLSPDQVREIRSTYKRGVFGYKKLSDQFGVCESTIEKVVKFKTYKDVK